MFLTSFLIGILSLLQAGPIQVGTLQIPAPVGYVNDFARVVPPANAQTMERIIADVKAKSGGEIVVVTLPDLAGRPKEEVALQIGRQWKVGQAGKPGDRARNTGVVILLVPKETSSDGSGHIEIQTGTGAEGFITDATAGAIQDEAMPFLRQRDYGDALELITLRVAQRYAGEFGFALDTAFQAPPTPEPMQGRGQGDGGGISPFALFIAFIHSRIVPMRRH